MSSDGIGTDRPISPLDREVVARIEVGHTNVSPLVRRVLVAWFLIMLAALPLAELVGQLRWRETAHAWSHLAGVTEAIERHLATPSDGTPGPRAWRRLVTANRALLERMSAFETALEDQSHVGRTLRPWTQWALSRWFGAGNERVYIGRDGWLFYRPDVEYVTGRGFLERREMERRVAAASEYEQPPQPDPRPAIRQFKHDLDARGIALVVVPTPVKPTIHPAQLARRAPLTAAAATGGEDDGTADSNEVGLQNASYAAFVDEMRREGILVFDPAEAIARARDAGAPQYLVTDTHWRPEAMRHAAEALVAFLDEHVWLQPVASPGYQRQRREARQTGDTAAMLDLPAGQTLYSTERVTLGFVVDSAGEPWRPSREADVLLLGDSFTNIYSLGTMGWGEAAGLAEQLSFTLQRPLDRIVQNDQGAHATRGILQRELESGADRLAGKRVVIWQFAARELAFGDWRVITLR
jgi:alginate O-acetyltransferase complex protein AlgJ